MNLLDSSGWIEYFANGPNADRFAPLVVDPTTLLVPTIVLHEVYRWADREGGEQAAQRAIVAMQEEKFPIAEKLAKAISFCGLYPPFLLIQRSSIFSSSPTIFFFNLPPHV
jgi:predicted nucleic acid-binding protein